MDPVANSFQLLSFGLPRRRGDGPWWCCVALFKDQLTPQARGWTAELAHEG